LKQGATPYCIAHGGGYRCPFRGCNKLTNGKNLFCRAHVGGKRCSVEAAQVAKKSVGSLAYRRKSIERAVNGPTREGSNRSKRSGGQINTVGARRSSSIAQAASSRPTGKLPHRSRICAYDGCDKYKQGTTLYCIAHGGGYRCTFPGGCNKFRKGKLFCIAHGGHVGGGGDMRCERKGGAKKSASGQGRRCSFEGCGESALSAKSKFCVKHCSGRKCERPGCGRLARGRTPFCKAHGGVDR
jgi:hypothetical protein